MAKVILPPGFEFLPTDEELLLDYLLARVTNKPLPVQGLIQHCDLYGDKHPWEIFKGQKIEKMAYFFTRLKKKTPNAKFAIRNVGDKANGGGTWKLQAKGTDIKDEKGRFIGNKSSLTYSCKGKCGYETELGRWTMKQYTLEGFLSGFVLPEFIDIVLCIITNHQDNKRKINQETEFGDTSSIFNDQEPPTVQPTPMDMPMASDACGLTIDSGIEQEQQQDDLFWQSNDGFAMGDGCDMIPEPNMEGHGVLSHEEALNLDPFFCVDDGFGVADFQEQNTQEPDTQHQVPTQEEQEAHDLDYFLGISVDDIEDLPVINGLANPRGPLFVDGIESIYMPDLQEMEKTDDMKDQYRQEFEITNTMMPLPVQNQISTQPEEAHVVDSSEVLLQCSFGDIQKPPVAQEPDIEHQECTQQEQQAYDMNYFSGISLDDIVDARWMNEVANLEDAYWMNGVTDLEDAHWMNEVTGLGGPRFVDGLESIYMADVQEMQKADNKKDQSRKRTCVFDQEDEELQINNKRIRREEEHEESENGWVIL